QSKTDVTVWSGRPDDVELITFDSKSKTVSLEGKKDKDGRYFIGATVRKPATAEAKPKEHEGDEDDGHGHQQTPPAEPSKAGTTTTFVSVSSANKLAESLATLKVLRAIGNIPEDRVKEFGLNEPEGTLTVKIRGTERKLIFGGPTPGGSDRYAR